MYEKSVVHTVVKYNITYYLPNLRRIGLINCGKEVGSGKQ